ncbi:MAG: thiamine phosphate synthase [Rhodospirillaceae bacterium]|nr:thiamine phosphate synthase [Rhodospirillaceae bacterium]
MRARNKAISAETPTCRLYLTTPPELVSGGVSVTAFAEQLNSVIAAADVACLRIAGHDPARVMTVAKAVLTVAQESGVAVLLDDPELALKLRADGVHLQNAGEYTKVRRNVGSDSIVGVACPLERHTAMEVGEAGADYVMFSVAADRHDDAVDLISWWTEIMTVPSVVAGPLTPVTAAQFIAAGADFLAPDAAIWSAADPVAAIAALLKA